MSCWLLGKIAELFHIQDNIHNIYHCVSERSNRKPTPKWENVEEGVCCWKTKQNICVLLLSFDLWMDCSFSLLSSKLKRNCSVIFVLFLARINKDFGSFLCRLAHSSSSNDWIDPSAYHVIYWPNSWPTLTMHWINLRGRGVWRLFII